MILKLHFLCDLNLEDQDHFNFLMSRRVSIAEARLGDILKLLHGSDTGMESKLEKVMRIRRFIDRTGTNQYRST